VRWVWEIYWGFKEVTGLHEVTTGYLGFGREGEGEIGEDLKEG
jgi:hypothetical protein